MIELSGIIVFGIFAQWIAWRFRLPAIFPLILIGLAVGPISTLFTDDNRKLLEPVWNGDKGLFPGELLYDFVTIAIGIILFEGGLTLKKREIKNVGNVIIKLITVGAFVTFVGAMITSHFLFDVSWSIASLFAALIIVTGPTVISPILRNIPLNIKISAILKWEGILIDPIGALVAVIAYEFIVSILATSEFTFQAFVNFFKLLLIGTSVGFSFAHFLIFLINKNKIPSYLLNVFTLSFVLIVFVFSDMIVHESGLLSVVVMGMIMGNKDLPQIKEIFNFKESLSLLLISILFILLSANINIEDFYLLFRKETILLFLIVIFVIRPLGVIVSTKDSGLNIREKLFISWVGPRGIVAAGMASLFGQRLMNKGIEGAEYITPLVFMIVLGTVLLNATTARTVAKLLGVYLKNSNGVLIIGATTFSRIFAEYLKKIGKHVFLIDSNADNIVKARKKELEAFNTDALSDDLSEPEFNSVGVLLALTPNNSINDKIIEKYKKEYGGKGYYKFMNLEGFQEKDISTEHIISSQGDFHELSRVVRLYPYIHEIAVDTLEELDTNIKLLQEVQDAFPLLIRDTKNKVYLINDFEEKDISKLLVEGQRLYLAYMGQELK